ncbi:MAG: phytanoyl-CoA dioxygenase family protein [Fimbriimonas sp.]
MVFRFSPEEFANGQPSPESVQAARSALLEHGVIILKGVVSPESVQALHEKMIADLPLWVNRPDAPFNWNPGNVQQDPPPFAPYLFKDVLFNPFALAISKSILGSMNLTLYSGNTAMPKSDKRQPVHADTGHLWPNHDPATPPYAIVVNLPTVPMGPWNGSTEVWPGTHLDTSVAMSDGDIKVSAEKIEAQRAIRPPFQPETEIGDLVMRDIRMWHAGVPNPSDAPRPMIAMIHQIGWLPTSQLEFSVNDREFFDNPDLHVPARWIEGDLAYTARNSAYEYAESK